MKDEMQKIIDKATTMGLFSKEEADQIGAVEGYASLELILAMAYQQAACSKGKERHASGLPFIAQPMQRESDDIGSWDGLIFQSRKKVREGIGLPTPDRQIREMLGAIVYLSGAVIWKLRQTPEEETIAFECYPERGFALQARAGVAEPFAQVEDRSLADQITTHLNEEKARAKG